MKQTSEKFDVEKYFLDLLQKDDSLSSGIAAIKTLLMVLEKTEFDTVQELHSTIQAAVQTMRNTDKPMTSVVSGSELFSRFITLAKFDDKTMAEVRQIMLARGKIFLEKLLDSRSVVAHRATSFIRDGCRILTHARSRTVRDTLIRAAREANRRFHVYVTESFPDRQGVQMQRELQAEGIECTVILDAAVGYVMESVDLVMVGAEGIECTVILDAAVGYVMESVDLVMVGAEGVVESGGIINRVGTFTMAMCAREMKKPFYVLVESFKFGRLYPLNQKDLPDDYKYPKTSLGDTSKVHPLVDYTPPGYITLLFTDLGVLTPSAISDELIKLYL